MDSISKSKKNIPHLLGINDSPLSSQIHRYVYYVTTLLDQAQSDSTYKSDMFAGLVAFRQKAPALLTAILPDDEERESFIQKMEDRHDNLTDASDELSFVLDPRRKFFETHPEEDRKRVHQSLRDFMENMCLFDAEHRVRGMRQFRDFTEFREDHERDFDDQIDPIVYWNDYSKSELGKVALILFHMITSSAAVERSFSAQGRIKSPLRNRLTQKRTEKLVSILFSDVDGSMAKKRKEMESKTKAPVLTQDDIQQPFGPLLLAQQDTDLFDAMIEGAAGENSADAHSMSSDDEDDDVTILKGPDDLVERLGSGPVVDDSGNEREDDAQSILKKMSR